MSDNDAVVVWCLLLALWICGVFITILSLRLLRQLRRPARRCGSPDGFSLYLEDANGTVYLAEPAHVWEADGRALVYYEDEERPDDATPLYRLRLERKGDRCS